MWSTTRGEGRVAPLSREEQLRNLETMLIRKRAQIRELAFWQHKITQKLKKEEQEEAIILEDIQELRRSFKSLT